MTLLDNPVGAFLIVTLAVCSCLIDSTIGWRVTARALRLVTLALANAVRLRLDKFGRDVRRSLESMETIERRESTSTRLAKYGEAID